MSKIKANLDGISGFRANIKDIKSKASECSSNLGRTKQNLDWQIKAKSNISNRISHLQRRVNIQKDKLDSLLRVLNSATDTYGNKDSQLSREVKNIIYTLNSLKYTAPSFNRSVSSLSPSASYQRGNTETINSIFSSSNAQSVNLRMLK